jgi:hypothetical protein
MSCIEEVRASEKKVQEVLGALEDAGAQDQDYLSNELRNATDEYARAIRELRLPRLRLRSLADLNTCLEQFLQKATKETDPEKRDELGAEIWKILRERERLEDQQSHQSIQQKIGRVRH